MSGNSDVNITIPSVPVIIQLDDDVPTTTSSITISPPPVLSVPPQPNIQKELGNGKGRAEALGPPPGKSLLGADLLQKSASLAMPPPSTTSVKKARNLVSPGMSMVKWMKLQESRIRPPTRKKIPLAEIAKHNTEKDCWMVIRNCVYDVTEYIPYHPGGIPELMKGAGKDATALFNEVHRWVNFDSILRSCLQGYLQIDVGESFEEAEEDSESKQLVTLPEAKFSQTSTDLIFQVDTKYNDELTDDNWCVSVLNRERLLLKVILKPPELWMAHLKLLESLNDDSISISFQNSYKRAVITIQKPSIGNWKQLGAPLADNNTIMDSRNSRTGDFSTGTIVEKTNLTHNVIMIGVQVGSSSFVGVPVGFHLKLRLLDGNAPARKYTPVIKSIVEESSTTSSTSGSAVVTQNTSTDGNQRVLYFIIKVYTDGQLTKEIDLLQVNSQLELGSVAGRYNPSFFSTCDTLALIAGGSGITPFIRVLDFLRKRSATYPIARIFLIFFNHSERDIIWRDQWTKLENTWNKFHFFPVISTPEQTWSGLSGRVDNVQLFESILLQAIAKERGIPKLEKNDNSQFGKFKAMLCGSCGFNEAFVTMLRSQSIVQVPSIDDDLFVF